MGWACSSDAFTCSDDAQCEGGPTGGTCVEGYCAFPSEVCSSGLQWGDHAGPSSGTCVPVGEGSGTDTGPGPITNATTSGPSPTSLDGESSLDASDASSGTEGPPPGVIEFRDDELPGEFEAGTMEGLAWDGERLTLAEGATEGVFTSRVFDAGETVAWQTVAWHPDGPYGKPLPDDGAVEVGYREGGADMTGNVLLMHLDGQGERAWQSGTEVLDASGAGSHGVVVSQEDVLSLIPGIFGDAIDDPWDGRISIPTDRATALELGEDDFTWALWVRTSSPCSSNNVFMGVDDDESAVDTYAHLWLGCTLDPWDECGGNAEVPHAAGTLRSNHDDPFDGGSYCSESAINDSQWHHVALVKEGHANATLRLYLDGVLEYVGEADFAQPIEYPSAPDFAVGGFSRGTYPSTADLDEVAIWRRALTTEEAIGLHRRGVTSLHVAVRVCTEPDCADEPPFGPLLSDPPHATGPELAIPLVELPEGRYVQYRLELAGQMPALRSVTIRGMLP